MGIFKKLFGVSVEKETSKYNRNEHEGNAPRIKVETKSVEPDPKQSNNLNMISWENFFGINLKKSPNEDWLFIETERNNNNTITSFETYKINDAYFSYVKALVIDSIATNFFFKCPYSWNDAFDIYFIIERDLVHKGNYSNTAAAKKFRGNFDSKYDIFDWEIDGFNIMMSRDIDTGDIELGVWTNFYNKDFLDTQIEEKSTQIQGCDVKIKDNDTTLTQEAQREAFVHYEMDYLVDPIEADYRRKAILDGTMNLNIVGIQYRENYAELAETLKEGMNVVLKAEPTNEFDPNALAFYYNGEVIGYLPKKDQPFAQIFMAKGRIEAAICNIDEKWIDTEVIITKDMIDFDAYENNGVRFTKIESFNGGAQSIKTIELKEFAETI